MQYMNRHVFPYVKDFDDTLFTDIVNICKKKNYKFNLWFNFIEIDTCENILLISWTEEFGYLFELCDYEYKAIHTSKKCSYKYLLMYVKNILIHGWCK